MTSAVGMVATGYQRLSLGRYLGVLIGIAVIFAVMSFVEPVFLTWGNWQNIIRAQSTVLALALGMTFVILTGGIDLSIASAAVGSLMVLGLTVSNGAPWWLGSLAGIAIGLGFGFVNGAMIGVLKIPFFVVTLGTLSIYQSIALLTPSPDGETISLFSYAHFNTIPNLINGTVGPIPTVLLLVGALYVIAAFVLHFTGFGRSVYAVGSNPEAARLAGINVTAVLIAVYTISGLAAGFGSIVMAGRLTAAGPQVDPTLMLNVIAAVLIGGTAFTGGDGGLLGTVIGVLFLGVLQNGLQLLSVSTFWQGTVSGGILILAVGIGVLRSSGAIGRRRARARGRDGPGAAAQGQSTKAIDQEEEEGT